MTRSNYKVMLEKIRPHRNKPLAVLRGVDEAAGREAKAGWDLVSFSVVDEDLVLAFRRRSEER